MLFLCVNVYCHRVTTQLQLINIIIIIIIIIKKYPLFLSDFSGIEFSEQIFDKYWNIRFHVNLLVYNSN